MASTRSITPTHDTMLSRAAAITPSSASRTGSGLGAGGGNGGDADTAQLSPPTSPAVPGRWGATRVCGLALLRDQVVDVEDRQVEADDHRADDATEHRDHQRLDHGGQRLGRRLDLLVVELRDLVQHRVERAGVLTDRHHLYDHRRERSEEHTSELQS